MRMVLQRVLSSYVEVDGQCVGKIDRGWLVLLAIGKGDTADIAEYLADRCLKLRGFPDEDGKMNRSAQDIGGSILVVSQFTLYADCVRGRRPGFDRAAPPELAKDLYNHFCQWLLNQGINVQKGVFQADMKVHLVNDGPVTFVIDKEV